MTGVVKTCPLATCGARLQRTRDVERDATLHALIAELPPDATTIWLRGDEIRTVALTRHAGSAPSASRNGAQVTVKREIGERSASGPERGPLRGGSPRRSKRQLTSGRNSGRNKNTIVLGL